jgi:hypothetical protein
MSTTETDDPRAETARSEVVHLGKAATMKDYAIVDTTSFPIEPKHIEPGSVPVGAFGGHASRELAAMNLCEMAARHGSWRPFTSDEAGGIDLCWFTGGSRSGGVQAWIQVNPSNGLHYFGVDFVLRCFAEVGLLDVPKYVILAYDLLWNEEVSPEAYGGVESASLVATASSN